MESYLSFLGAPRFQYNGVAASLTSTKAVALLAYLAVTGVTHTRDHIIDMLWPDSLPDAGRKNLRNTLWAIRKALGDELLEADGDRMGLAAEVESDVRQLETTARRLSTNEPVTDEQLGQTAGYYRGVLLDGTYLADAPDFEVWLAAERERFNQHYLRLLAAQIANRRAAGDWQGVITISQKVLAVDDLQEPIYRALMDAHARLGERAEALRVYDTLHDRLAYELGVDPLPETETLRATILHGDQEPQRQSEPVPPPRPLQPTRPFPFVGRQAELAALDDEFAMARLGRLRVVLITGELGIGKTELWKMWSAQLPPGTMVLETRCLNTTHSLPFAPLTGLFKQSACVETLFKTNSPVPSVWLTELVRLMPEIREHRPNLPQPLVLPPDEEHHRLFEAFAQLLWSLQGQPLLLFIDDIHWIDPSTLDWLVYLADRMEHDPLLLVATYRPGEAPAQVSQATAGWGRRGLLKRLSLTGFSIEEALALLESQGLAAERVNELQTRSAGNPYFLIELSQADPGNTPPDLVELVKVRLNQLSDEAKQVLQAAAVLESEFDLALLRRTSGRGEEETLNAVDDLLTASVLQEKNGYFEFSHPLVTTVVWDGLSLARRSFLHRRAADALEAGHPNRLPALAGRLAVHYSHAGRPQQAAQYAEQAAAYALALTAVPEAINFYRQAIQLEPTPARQLGLGEAQLAHGDLKAGRDTLVAAAKACKAAADPVGVARAYLALSSSFMVSGQGEQVIHYAQVALTSLGTRFHPELIARSHHLRAAGGLLAGRPLAEAEELLNQAISLATEHNLPELAGLSRFELGNLLAQRGNLTQALKSFTAALNFAQATGNLFQQALAHNNLAFHAILAGQLTLARQHVEQGLELVQQHALFLPNQYLYSTRGELALVEGDPATATDWFLRALAEAERFGNDPQTANIRANLGLAARAGGDDDEALGLLEEARQAALAQGTRFLQVKIDLWLAELFFAQAEQVAALSLLAEAEARLAGSGFDGLAEWASRLRAEHPA
jgi:DNA-binding SARP family transcriptional activator